MMITKFFLVVNQNGTIKAVKTRPGLKWDEVSVAVTLQLPNVLFQKPQMNASIIVPETAISPVNIETDVADNIREAIETATGYQVKLTIQSPD